MEVSREKRNRIVAEMDRTLTEQGVGDLVSIDQMIEAILTAAYSVGYSDGLNPFEGEDLPPHMRSNDPFGGKA